MNQKWYACTLQDAETHSQFFLPYEHWLGRGLDEAHRLGLMLEQKLLGVKYTRGAVIYEEGQRSMSCEGKWHDFKVVYLANPPDGCHLTNNMPVFHHNPDYPAEFFQVVYEWGGDEFVLLERNALGLTQEKAAEHTRADDVLAWLRRTGAEWAGKLVVPQYGSHTVYQDVLSGKLIGLLGGPTFLKRENDLLRR